MAISKPGKVLLHKIPLHFVHEKVSGGGKKGVDQSIPLVPFIDFLITLVVFLLMSFSASGELVAQQPSITMPSAEHATPLEVAPIIAIDDRAVTLDGTRVADSATLAANAVRRCEVHKIEADRKACVSMARGEGEVAGTAATALIDWIPDAAIGNIVNTWPAGIHSVRASGLGLLAEESFEAIIRDYIRETPYAVTLPIR